MSAHALSVGIRTVARNEQSAEGISQHFMCQRVRPISLADRMHDPNERAILPRLPSVVGPFLAPTINVRPQIRGVL